MDTFFSDVPAHDDSIRGQFGATMVQFYRGTLSKITAVFLMKNESEMTGTLQARNLQAGRPEWPLQRQFQSPIR
jgi:hypothetical protein